MGEALRDPQASHRLVRRTAAAVATGAVMLAIVLGAAMEIPGIGWAFPAAAAALYGLAGVAVVLHIRVCHPFDRFGPGNLVTLLRLGLTCLVAGAAAQTAVSGLLRDEATAWLFTGVAVVLVALDGVDGALARRAAVASPFGERFDFEVDALLILLLAICAVLLGKAGAWILLAGAMRYLFVAAALIWPQLGAPLPPSWRRKAVCVAETAALVALLAPALVPPASRLLAAGGLALLVWSFAVDILRLTRQSPLACGRQAGERGSVAAATVPGARHIAGTHRPRPC